MQRQFTFDEFIANFKHIFSADNIQKLKTKPNQTMLAQSTLIQLYSLQESSLPRFKKNMSVEQKEQSEAKAKNDKQAYAQSIQLVIDHLDIARAFDIYHRGLREDLRFLSPTDIQHLVNSEAFLILLENANLLSFNTINQICQRQASADEYTLYTLKKLSENNLLNQNNLDITLSNAKSEFHKGLRQIIFELAETQLLNHQNFNTVMQLPNNKAIDNLAAAGFILASNQVFTQASFNFLIAKADASENILQLIRLLDDHKLLDKTHFNLILQREKNIVEIAQKCITAKDFNKDTFSKILANFPITAPSQSGFFSEDKKPAPAATSDQHTSGKKLE